jgi:hypothetical protein
MVRRKKSKTTSIHLRLPTDVYEAIAKAAFGNSPPNSINREIADRLKQTLRAPALNHEERIAMLERMLAEAMKDKR